MDTNLPTVKRGVGRPAGVRMTQQNKLIMREKQAFNRIASRRAQKILNAQTVTALGTYHLIELFRDKNNVVVERHIVRDLKRQEVLLNDFEHGVDYQILEGTPPDWRAGDAILNRAWGKPKESIEVDVAVFSLRALHVESLTEPEKRSAIDITDNSPLSDNVAVEPLLDDK